jgi:hypothetical protein
VQHVAQGPHDPHAERDPVTRWLSVSGGDSVGFFVRMQADENSKAPYDGCSFIGPALDNVVIDQLLQDQWIAATTRDDPEFRRFTADWLINRIYNRQRAG